MILNSKITLPALVHRNIHNCENGVYNLSPDATSQSFTRNNNDAILVQPTSIHHTIIATAYGKYPSFSFLEMKSTSNRIEAKFTFVSVPENEYKTRTTTTKNIIRRLHRHLRLQTGGNVPSCSQRIAIAPSHSSLPYIRRQSITEATNLSRRRTLIFINRQTNKDVFISTSVFECAHTDNTNKY